MLGVMVVALTLLHLGGQLINSPSNSIVTHSIIEKFNVDMESNIPTYFSSLLLLIISMLLGIIAISKDTSERAHFNHWTALSIIFFLLSMDEIAGFHEGLSGFLKTIWVTTGFLHYSWVVPGMAFVLIFLALFFKFWRDLPPKTRLLFLIAGVIYVSGAIGFELIGGNYAYLYGENNLTFHMIAMIEEFLEMSGCLCLIYALLKYAEEHAKHIEITFLE